MSTPWLELTDGLDSQWKMTVETGCSGMKLFIVGPDGLGAKFWFKDAEQVEELREALEWIGPHHFGRSTICGTVENLERGGSLTELGQP